MKKVIVSEWITELSKIRELGQKTAACLLDIGINTPQELILANANDIVKRFHEKADKKEPGFYKVSTESVCKWIAAAKSGDWEYSKAEEKFDTIKQRANEDGIEFDIDREPFRKFYGKDGKDRQCCYCNIKESQIKQLFDSCKIFTKRKHTRGKNMEIDRIDSQRGYIYRGDDSNIAICCYWCNNAKTDEFTEKEFLSIAAGIKKAFEKRLV